MVSHKTPTTGGAPVPTRISSLLESHFPGANDSSISCSIATRLHLASARWNQHFLSTMTFKYIYLYILLQHLFLFLVYYSITSAKPFRSFSPIWLLSWVLPFTKVSNAMSNPLDIFQFEDWDAAFPPSANATPTVLSSNISTPTSGEFNSFTFVGKKLAGGGRGKW